jgi:hypothetical protein
MINQLGQVDRLSSDNQHGDAVSHTIGTEVYNNNSPLGINAQGYREPNNQKDLYTP